MLVISAPLRRTLLCSWSMRRRPFRCCHCSGVTYTRIRTKGQQHRGFFSGQLSQSSNTDDPVSKNGAKPNPRVSPEEIAAAGVELPHYAKSGNEEHETSSWMPKEPVVLDQEEQDKLRESCSVASAVQATVSELLIPGVTTDTVEQALHSEIVSRGAYPSQLNFGGFPCSVSVSVNEVAVHGVAGARTLQEGDIVSVDVSTFVHGFHGDCTRTYIVGNRTDAAGQHLVGSALELLHHGIAACGPGERLSKVGHAIHRLSTRRGLKVVPVLCGHGIGRAFHAPPDVYHVLNNYPGVMRPGMAFTVEPCVAEGQARVVVPEGGLDVRTADGGRAAQFEHTLLVTEKGVEVLTEDRWRTAAGRRRT